MILGILRVVYERGIFAEILGNFPMAIEELIEARQLATSGVVVAITVTFVTVVAIFLPHESIRIFFYLLANVRMVFQITLQLGMTLLVFRVIYERWILAKLLGDLPMVV